MTTDHPLDVPGPEAIQRLLRAARTIAVVGLSDKPDRDSYKVAAYLQRVGYRIFPVNPALEQVLGEKCYPSLRDLPQPVDIVDIFRRADAVPPIVEEAIACGAGCVWMQLGIRHDEAARRARDAGLSVVMDRCILIDHMAMPT
ncbi:MAG: CoA-binding protein [Gemmataceae bacterium]